MSQGVRGTLTFLGSARSPPSISYRDERRKRQYDALSATAIDIDSDDDPETTRKQLREARRVVAARDCFCRQTQLMGHEETT